MKWRDNYECVQRRKHRGMVLYLPLQGLFVQDHSEEKEGLQNQKGGEGVRD